MPIPLFEEYGIGLKPSISTKNLREKLGLKAGVVSTGNSLGCTEACMEIMKEHSAKAKVEFCRRDSKAGPTAARLGDGGRCRGVGSRSL